jgi:hypothetical protein
MFYINIHAVAEVSSVGSIGRGERRINFRCDIPVGVNKSQVSISNHSHTTLVLSVYSQLYISALTV